MRNVLALQQLNADVTAGFLNCVSVASICQTSLKE